eukprot:CAMPEP_0171447854 /NCGR_PEP_ID=MMETSP0881-20121228/39319_1 /TAXON_ID=67004 /ORGANISM="Thalassiosira weissflogii, Strain CCMP1336" /LENGTH=370 /DNA_ID=CAMNT_0011972275 /DNA_START=416 /DNA_END=1531 /DNA_ORIENTATION=-
MTCTYDPSKKNYQSMRIASLHRYAVKGLSGDSLVSVTLNEGDGTFEDDRRFALLFDSSSDDNVGGDEKDAFDEANPAWLHKANFLCAFTAPELLATLLTEYLIESSSSGVRRLLRVRNRSNASAPELLATLLTEYLIESSSSGVRRLLRVRNRNNACSSALLLEADLASTIGREEASKFFSDLCKRKVRCVVATNTSNLKEAESKHTHQFGNTSSGVKNNNGDTRTIHIINSNTVKDFSNRIFRNDTDDFLTSTRFRPNIIVDNLEPWAEFDLIGKTIEVIKDIDDSKNTSPSSSLRLRIVSRTVRCDGVGVDPCKPELGKLDIPKLLVEHFPEYGPYLGVYAIVEKDSLKGDSGQRLCVGDSLRVVDGV